MKKLIFLTIICILSSSAIFSQTNDQISIEKKRFYLNDKKLTNKELKNLLRTYPESSEMLKKANLNSTVGTVLMGAGTVTILIAAANPPEEDGVLPGLISREENMRHLTPVLIGAGVALAGIPFYIAGSKNIEKAVTIYNSKKSSAYHSKLQFDIGLTQNGIGITCRF